MVVAVCRGEHSVVQARLPARLEDRLVLSGPYGGDLVLLLALPDPVTAARELAEVARRTGVTIGVAGPAGLGSSLVAAHRQAARLVATMVRLGRKAQAAAPDDLGLAGLVGAAEADVAGHVEYVLGPVTRYDAQRGTDLVGTLRAYFARPHHPHPGLDPMRPVLQFAAGQDSLSTLCLCLQLILGFSVGRPGRRRARRGC
jgi:hypothetical protein